MTARVWPARLALLCIATGVVCLAQDDFAARVVQMQGQVSLLKDGYPWALSQGDKIPAGQVIVTGADGYARFQVSDGSTFEVYPNSHVTFRANGTNWRDLIDVWLGRIRVHIQKLGGEPNPNRVQTPTAVISVRGTTFDVAVDDDEQSTYVEVEEGVVAVEHRLMPRSGDPKLLHGGESLMVYRNLPLSGRNRLDKGHMLQVISRVGSQVIFRMPRPGAGGGPTTAPPTTLPGTGGKLPPPPPPPLPPPPPPPPGGGH